MPYPSPSSEGEARWGWRVENAQKSAKFELYPYRTPIDRAARGHFPL